MKATKIAREFKFTHNGHEVILDDIEGMDETEIKDFYATQYPTLTNAEVNYKGIDGDKQVYEFSTKVMTKG